LEFSPLIIYVYVPKNPNLIGKQIFEGIWYLSFEILKLISVFKLSFLSFYKINLFEKDFSFLIVISLDFII